MYIADSRFSDAQIEKLVASAPPVQLENGNIRTGPVRLSFPNIFTMSRPNKADIKPSYGANLIFPTCVDLKVLKAAVAETLKTKCPEALLPKNDKRYKKVKLPFLDQGEMLKYEGYIEGGEYIIVNSQKRPACVDRDLVAVTDDERVYPGVWAICTVAPYWYDVDVNKGVSFGLRSVMLIADDTNLGGGSEDIADAFGDVKIDVGDINLDELFA